MKPNQLVYALEQYLIQRDTHVEHFNVKKNAQLNLEELQKIKQREQQNSIPIYLETTSIFCCVSGSINNDTNFNTFEKTKVALYT
jgi:hypothetical protein